jgi:spectinomycin phosphotransferase
VPSTGSASGVTVREPPSGVAEAEILAAVRRGWAPEVTRVEHLPLGFGAHHWAAYDDSAPLLFVTFDGLAPRRTAAHLEAAYAGALALHDRGLEFVLAPLVSSDGTLTIPVAYGALSCTPWRDGDPDGELDVAWTSAALARLHAVDPPPGIPRWHPLVGPDFAAETAELVGVEWGPGPFAHRARDAVRRHLGDLADWTARYHHLARVAETHSWVATHGEPESGNQLLTTGGRLLVDWESLKLAPAELDLRTLVDAGVETDADPEMVELFDLEWRLDEISQYAEWFAAPHTGTADDETAFDGLLHELVRP